MRVIFKTADNIKELFDLIVRDRDDIEQEIGFGLLSMFQAGVARRPVISEVARLRKLMEAGLQQQQQPQHNRDLPLPPEDNEG